MNMMAPKHLYSDGDLVQLLRALALTAAASSPEPAFVRGYAVALAAVATAGGVPASELRLPDVRRELPR